MKIKYILSAVFAVAILMAGNLSMAQGVQKMRITGVEMLNGEPAPAWTSFSSIQTLTIPSLQVAEYVLYIDWTSPGNISFDHEPFGGFKGYGTGAVYDGDGLQIGAVTFFYVGENLNQPAPPVLEINYQGTINAVGTIWAGPLEGLIISEKISMAGLVVIDLRVSGIPTYPEYLGCIEGFLTAPEYIDFEALKASFKD